MNITLLKLEAKLELKQKEQSDRIMRKAHKAAIKEDKERTKAAKKEIKETKEKKGERIKIITPINPDTWSVSRITNTAIKAVKGAELTKGACVETVMNIIIDDKDRHLFTLNIENRLLALFRYLYKEVVLIEFETPQDIAKKKAYILKRKLSCAHAVKERQYKDSLNITKKAQSAIVN